ncbi:ELMO domain-containing protein 3 [Phytophthora cactorum]|nr:ELMO domain-containing protein 3 [Phytophthora cactorum]
MESSGPSDVDVLDDLLHDVDGEGDNFEDAEAFFDTGPDQDGEGMDDMTADNILSQLDAVTTLDEDDGLGDEFQDSTSAPSSPQLSGPDDEDTTEIEEQQSKQINENETPTSTQEQLSPPQEIVQSEEEVSSDEGGLERPVKVEARDDEDDTVLDESIDAVVISTPSSKRQNEEVVDAVESQEMPPSPPVHEAMNEASSVVLPPPAPTTVPIIVGSMNAVEEDNDVSDDSQGEEDGEDLPLPPPLQLNIPEDDDEDVLEVDAAVVTSLQIEEKQRMSKEETSSDTDNALLKALPSSKADDSSAIDLSFSEEVRVAHVTTLEPSSPFSDIHRIAGGSNSSKLTTDTTFGISYQSLRKKEDEPHSGEKDGNYSLPNGPAFPDERDFENEMEITSDVSFSVATSGGSPSKVAGNADDDEFSFDVNPEVDSSVLSEGALKSRRESLEAKKRKEEEELLKELKRATDEEKKLIESRSSVMGRIFSPTQGMTETIVEEADGDDSEGEENTDNERKNAGSANVFEDKAEDKKAITEESDVDEASEWREIKLVQHRQSHENSESTKASSSPETALISYTEAAKYYAETPDVMQHRDIIVSEDFPRGSCMKCLSRPRLTFPGAIEERDRVFCIAATAFDAHNEIVVGILQTIYKKITKSTRDVLLIGRHWEDIGFQGSDPSTDFRGCGMLSLLQILYLVETFPDLAHRFHALSQHPTRHFPFACVLINITLQCVVALRSGALYPECNKQSSVLTGMNRLYVALASQLHDAMQSRSDEIPLILKDILDRGRSNPIKLIGEAFDGDSLRPSRPVAATGPSKSKPSDRKEADNNLEFTEIGLQAVDEEE